ncbi:uncharacterized protein LOC144095476 [Amblyomma americanum]
MLGAGVEPCYKKDHSPLGAIRYCFSQRDAGTAELLTGLRHGSRTIVRCLCYGGSPLHGGRAISRRRRISWRRRRNRAISWRRRISWRGRRNRASSWRRRISWRRRRKDVLKSSQRHR